MTKQLRVKQERVIEAVRRGLEGDAAVEFIRQSGYAMTPAGIARHLRSMGGRGAVQAMINDGQSNIEIMEACFPDADLDELRQEPPSQTELFSGEVLGHPADIEQLHDAPIYETRKISVKVPADLYEAIRLASRAEGLSQNQLIVDILTSALARAPHAWNGQGTLSE
ncbi:MAG: hypothetical protein JXR94_18880 [Candidatus Hydrogenedentes bacterium]|nr:hypothetical protein [Candidatus Hydrogenedentota bacterium]